MRSIRGLDGDASGKQAQLVQALRAEIRAPGISAGVRSADGRRRLLVDGLADVERAVPMDPATPMRIGSISKTFVAAGVLLLAERGALDLEDPAVAHLPELRALDAGGHRLDSVTVRRLLLHRSGLICEPPTRDVSRSPFPSIGEVLERIDLARLAIAPGSATKYSNLGYALLGEIVARAAGTSYERFVHEALLEPAGMTATTFEPPANAAVGYAAGADGNWVAQPLLEFGAERPAGGMWSTTDDMLRWAEVALGRVPRVLSPTAAELLARPSTTDDASLERGRSLGWLLRRHGERVLHEHDGLVRGFCSDLMFDGTTGHAAVVLVNGHLGAAAACLKLLETEAPPPSVQPPAESPEPGDPVGAYTDLFESAIRIDRRHGVLWIANGIAGTTGARLEPAGRDRWVVCSGRFAGEPLVVERAPDGSVDGFVVAGWRHVRVVDGKVLARTLRSATPRPT